MPQTASPVRAPAQTARAEPDRLILQAGDARWAVPEHDLLCIADAAGDLTPIPHAPPAVRGLACIEGHPVPVVDLAPGRPGGALVVVASGTGGIALRADAVSRGSAPALPLADLVPWAPPPAAERPPLPRPMPAASVARVPLLLVACGGTMAALPAEAVARVGTVTAVQPLRDGGALVRVDDTLLPARRLADSLPTLATGGEGRWAVVLRGEEPAALLVDGVVGLESADPDRIATVTPPGGAPQRWLDRPGADPVPVMDAAAPFGRPANPIPGARPDRPAAVTPAAERAVLMVQAEDLRLAVPLGLLGRVLEPGARVAKRPAPGALPVFDLAVALGRRARPQAGALILIRTTDGAPRLLSVDRVLALAPPPEPWQPAPPLPPGAALAFDAVCFEAGRWTYRLRAGPPAPAPAALRRALAAARLGWADPDTPV